jgi:HEAT repeat protein
MKDETLGSYLKDDDAEIRRAAALACALKESKALVPLIIPLLDDPQKDIVPRAAQLALKALAGQDLGPSRDAWQAWWDKQGK